MAAALDCYKNTSTYISKNLRWFAHVADVSDISDVSYRFWLSAVSVQAH